MALGDEAGVKAAEKFDLTVEKLKCWIGEGLAKMDRRIGELKAGNRLVMTNTTTISIEPKETNSLSQDPNKP